VRSAPQAPNDPRRWISEQRRLRVLAGINLVIELILAVVVTLLATYEDRNYSAWPLVVLAVAPVVGIVAWALIVMTAASAISKVRRSEVLDSRPSRLRLARYLCALRIALPVAAVVLAGLIGDTTGMGNMAVFFLPFGFIGVMQLLFIASEQKHLTELPAGHHFATAGHR